jgi:copper oxidase (laccase) domain-containing protein
VTEAESDEMVVEFDAVATPGATPSPPIAVVVADCLPMLLLAGGVFVVAAVVLLLALL